MSSSQVFATLSSSFQSVCLLLDLNCFSMKTWNIAVPIDPHFELDMLPDDYGKCLSALLCQSLGWFSFCS